MFWMVPSPSWPVESEGLWLSPTKNVTMLVVTGILGVGTIQFILLAVYIFKYSNDKVFTHLKVSHIFMKWIRV